MCSLSELLTWEREHRTSVMTSFVVGGGLLCFLTMAVKNSMVENSTVGDAIRNGPMFHIAMASSISLGIPVLMNLMVDIYVENFGIEAKKTMKEKTTNDKDIVTDTEKLVLLVGVVIFPIASCFSGWSRAILLASCASSAAVTSTSMFLFCCCFFPHIFYRRRPLLKTIHFLSLQ